MLVCARSCSVSRVRKSSLALTHTNPEDNTKVRQAAHLIAASRQQLPVASVRGRTCFTSSEESFPLGGRAASHCARAQEEHPLVVQHLTFGCMPHVVQLGEHEQ